MTIEKLTDAEIEIAMKPYSLPFAYIYYNDDGQVTMISPIKYDHLKYLEVPFERAKDFLAGKKDSSKYDLEYFKTGISVVVKNESLIRKNIIYEIPVVEAIGDNDLTIVHNNANKCWEIVLTRNAIDLLEKQNVNSLIKFYLTEKSKPHLLITTIDVKGSELFTRKYIKFVSEIEQDLDAVSVYTYPDFASYGLIKHDKIQSN
jgi:hypothetical protein